MDFRRWQHQWLRALRWYNRTAAGYDRTREEPLDPDEAEDFTYVTWQAVWHVADYLNQDRYVRERLGLADKQRVHEMAREIPELALVEDLANVTKHAQLTQRWTHPVRVGAAGYSGWVGRDGDVRPEVVWLYVRVGDEDIPGLVPAYDALHAWRTLFRRWKLEWDQRQPELPWPSWGEPPGLPPASRHVRRVTS